MLLGSSTAGIPPTVVTAGAGGGDVDVASVVAPGLALTLLPLHPAREIAISKIVATNQAGRGRRERTSSLRRRAGVDALVHRSIIAERASGPVGPPRRAGAGGLRHPVTPRICPAFRRR